MSDNDIYRQHKEEQNEARIQDATDLVMLAFVIICFGLINTRGGEIRRGRRKWVWIYPPLPKVTTLCSPTKTETSSST